MTLGGHLKQFYFAVITISGNDFTVIHPLRQAY